MRRFKKRIVFGAWEYGALTVLLHVIIAGGCLTGIASVEIAGISDRGMVFVLVCAVVGWPVSHVSAGACVTTVMESWCKELENETDLHALMKDVGV